MEELKVKLIGTAPLLTHNNRGANPLGAYAQAMKPLTSKRNKTDVDYGEIARLEWEAGLYLDNGVVVLPARCLEKTFLLGARKAKNGKKYESGAMVKEDFCELSYKGTRIKVTETGEIPNPDLDKYYDKFCHQAMVRVGTNQVLRTRPIFYDWSLDVTVSYNESQIDERSLFKCLKDSGRLVGLCEQRPRLGSFEVKKIEESE